MTEKEGFTLIDQSMKSFVSVIEGGGKTGYENISKELIRKNKI